MDADHELSKYNLSVGFSFSHSGFRVRLPCSAIYRIFLSPILDVLYFTHCELHVVPKLLYDGDIERKVVHCIRGGYNEHQYLQMKREKANVSMDAIPSGHVTVLLWEQIYTLRTIPIHFTYSVQL